MLKTPQYIQRLSAFLAALFLVAQFLCCFHTHASAADLEGGHSSDTACEICLVSKLPTDLAAAPDIDPRQYYKLPQELPAAGHVPLSQKAALFQARAPPLAP